MPLQRGEPGRDPVVGSEEALGLGGRVARGGEDLGARERRRVVPEAHPDRGGLRRGGDVRDRARVHVLEEDLGPPRAREALEPPQPGLDPERRGGRGPGAARADDAVPAEGRAGRQRQRGAHGVGAVGGAGREGVGERARALGVGRPLPGGEVLALFVGAEPLDPLVIGPDVLVAQALDGHPQRVAEGRPEERADEAVAEGGGLSGVGHGVAEGGRSYPPPPLPVPLVDWLAGTWAVVANDARLELRTRVALGGLALFVAASLVLVRVALGRGAPSVAVASAVLWVVVVFAAAVGMGRAFVAEEERGTSLLLQLHLRPSQVYAGKLLFNTALMAAVTALAVVGLRVLVPTPLGAPGVLAATVGLVALGLAAATTLLSALIARARAAGPLLPVLSFPVVIPVLVPAVALAELAAGTPDGVWALARGPLVQLGAYAGLLISASFLLFEYVWRD